MRFTLAAVGNEGGALQPTQLHTTFLCDHIHRETWNQRLDLLWHSALCSLSSCLCYEDLSLILYHCICHKGSISIHYTMSWDDCLWQGSFGRATDMQWVCHLINSMRQQSRFPKVKLLEWASVIMSISKSALLIVWVQTGVLLLCWGSTGGRWYNSKVPACRFNIHEFRLIKSSAAFFCLRFYPGLCSHRLSCTWPLCTCVWERFLSCLAVILYKIGSSQSVRLWHW